MIKFLWFQGEKVFCQKIHFCEKFDIFDKISDFVEIYTDRIQYSLLHGSIPNESWLINKMKP